jgi:adenylate cyclase
MSVFTDPEVDAFRSQLHKVLNSADFDASKRNREFLSYVVEEAIAGRAHRIKAYNIATAVFGRDSNFDPQADPVVRIEARRLRRSLEHYYLTAGKKDSLTVSIPKGGYAPSFQTKRADRSDTPVVVRENWRGSETGPDLRAQGPVIFVASFEEEGDQSTFPNFTHGFTRGLIVALTRFNDLVVFGTDTSLAYSSDCSLEQLRTDLGIDFLVRGGTAISSDRFDVEILLIDAQAGRSLWAENFSKDLKPANIVAVRDEVANSIARTLAQPFGVIFSLKAQETEGRPPNDLESYDCVIRYYQYWRSIDRDLHAQARACLEQAIARNPHYAEGIACLSQIYTDAYRFGFDSGLDEDDPRDKALALARRAIDLAPSSSRGHHALSLAYRFIGDSQASFDSLQTALNLNPNDTEIMADLGLRYAMSTEWNKAVPLLEEAYRRNPALPGTFRVGLSLYHLAHGRYEEALNEARKVTAPRIVYGHVLEAAAAAGLCLSDEAASAITAIRSIDPDYGQHVVSDLQKRSLHPDMIALIVDWLARAGLPGCDTGAQVIPIQKAKRAK